MTDRFSAYVALVESTLPTLIPQDRVPDQLGEAMHYALMAGGKRIRPILTLLSAELFGAEKTLALPTACSIEMIHTYSLIHDDLPAMDDDDLRRGKPTVHIQFDEALAILTGDALQSLAFKTISNDDQLSPSCRLAIIQRISEAIGPGGMVAGQVLDMAAEKIEIDGTHLIEMHNRKTGDLIAASVMAGAIIAGATEEEQAGLEAFGYNLGLAFQVRDDLLDVLSDTETLGKPQGSDARQDKRTFTSIFGMDGAKTRLDRLHKAAITALEPFGNRSAPLEALTDFVVDRIH